MDYKTFLDNQNSQIRQVLLESLPSVDPEIPSLWDEIRKALQSGSTYCLALYIAVLYKSFTGLEGKEYPQPLMTAGCGVEMIYAGHGILIDMPALGTSASNQDSESLHKGAILLLAADSIHTYVFEWILENLPGLEGYQLVTQLAEASGWKGILGAEDENDLLNRFVTLAQFAGRITAQKAGVSEEIRLNIDTLSVSIGEILSSLNTSNKSSHLLESQIKTAIEKAYFLPHRGIELFQNYLDYIIR